MRLDARAEKQPKAAPAGLSLTDRSDSPGGILPLQPFALRAPRRLFAMQDKSFLTYTGHRYVDATPSHR